MILAILGLLFFQRVQPTPRPNVIVVVADDLSPEALNIPQAQYLNQLANYGLLFTNAYGMPTCSPARGSLMFGQYGQEAGILCDPPLSTTPSTSLLALPEIFPSSYSSVFIGKWHLGTNDIGLPPELTPVAHGFDTTRAGMPANTKTNCGPLGGAGYYEWVKFNDSGMSIETEYNTITLRNQFATWWTSTTGPKFAYLAFQAPHAPFQNPPQELLPNPIPWPQFGMTFQRRQYLNLVLTLDTVLGQLAQFVNFNNTYIIFVADNGTSGDVVPPGRDPNKAKGTSFQGGVRIPFLIIGPNVPRGTSDRIVSLVDVMPTIAELIGVPVPPLDGVSLVPLIQNPQGPQVHTHIFAGLDPDKSVIQERYKLRLINNTEEFYDLFLDPLENVILDPNSLDPLIVQSLRDQMQNYINRGL